MNVNKKILIVGITSGMSMVLIQMIYEAISPLGTGFWSPLVYTSASLITSAILLSSAYFPIILGLTIQMVISIILCVVYEVIVEVMKIKESKVMFNVLFAVSVSSLMWFVILPAVDPIMLYLNSNIFFLSHLVWVFVIEAMMKEEKIKFFKNATVANMMKMFAK